MDQNFPAVMYELKQYVQGKPEFSRLAQCTNRWWLGFAVAMNGSTTEAYDFMDVVYATAGMAP